jgi:hypothetical protein
VEIEVEEAKAGNLGAAGHGCKHDEVGRHGSIFGASAAAPNPNNRINQPTNQPTRAGLGWTLTWSNPRRGPFEVLEWTITSSILDEGLVEALGLIVERSSSAVCRQRSSIALLKAGAARSHIELDGLCIAAYFA